MFYLDNISIELEVRGCYYMKVPFRGTNKMQHIIDINLVKVLL